MEIMVVPWQNIETRYQSLVGSVITDVELVRRITIRFPQLRPGEDNHLMFDSQTRLTGCKSPKSLKYRDEINLDVSCFDSPVTLVNQEGQLRIARYLKREVGGILDEPYPQTSHTELQFNFYRVRVGACRKSKREVLIFIGRCPPRSIFLFLIYLFFLEQVNFVFKN
jgi:hypothetical protein